MTENPNRTEKDSMGEMTLPASALHGASTHRAVLNFPVSGYRFSRPFIRALGLIKWAAAQANHDLVLLDAERSPLADVQVVPVAVADVHIDRVGDLRPERGPLRLEDVSQVVVFLPVRGHALV